MEIERKFLVDEHAFCKWIRNQPSAWPYAQISQHYLNRTPEVRVRSNNYTYHLCFKSPTRDPTTRHEVEFEIYPSVARQLIRMATHVLHKERFSFPFEGRQWVVDHIIDGDLWIAEIELKSPDETFTKPDWVLEEVTGRPEYSSFSLASPIR